MKLEPSLSQPSCCSPTCCLAFVMCPSFVCTPAPNSHSLSLCADSPPRGVFSFFFSIQLLKLLCLLVFFISLHILNAVYPCSQPQEPILAIHCKTYLVEWSHIPPPFKAVSGPPILALPLCILTPSHGFPPFFFTYCGSSFCGCIFHCYVFAPPLSIGVFPSFSHLVSCLSSPA